MTDTLTWTVAVRALCAFTAKAGDLDLRFTPAPSAQEGQAGHRQVQSQRPAGYVCELPLSGSYTSAEDPLQLQVRGRADGWDAAAGRLEEIKTYRGRLDDQRPSHRALHWAQALVYGHLLCQSQGRSHLHVALVYWHIDRQHETVLVRDCSAAELQQHFDTLCARYVHWAQQAAAHRRARDAALVQLRFPLGTLRPGQRRLAEAIYRMAQAPGDAEAGVPRQGRCLMAQAPTGIGKTLGTLFPLLKAMPGQRLDQVLFLTAKGTGQDLALQALQTLCAPAATKDTAAGPPQSQRLPLRVLALTARDKACVHPDKACHGVSCPLAAGFYDRLPAARAAAVASSMAWDGPTLQQLAHDHQVCPYYLAQDLVPSSDVVVADYHYYYDSSAQLYAQTQVQPWRVGVLVDEAHNLLERARSMYSATLSPWTLQAARQASRTRGRGAVSAPVKQALGRLHRQWQALAAAQTTPYQAYTELPATFFAAVQHAVGALGEAQTDVPWLPGDPLLALYLELLAFSALAEQFGPHALCDVQWSSTPPARPRARRNATPVQQGLALQDDSATVAQPASKPVATAAAVPFSSITLRNVLPAPHLAARHAAAQLTVLFSGTLSPPTFYRDLLGLPAHTAWLDVPAPAQAQQLQVQLAAHIDTRWHARVASLRPLVDTVAAQWARQPGNYLCFVSSLDYAQQVTAALQLHHPYIPLWCQTPGMDAAQRSAFLARFVEGGQGVGVAVLGGAFAEGVDLPGSRLIGAFIATLGLPQYNPVNEALQQALVPLFGAQRAADYTYLYPGLRKVVQAAGRVIRTEHDRGTLVLMDRRYAQPAVQSLLPPWWGWPSQTLACDTAARGPG